MLPSNELMTKMDQELMQGIKTPHNISNTVITKINDEYYLSAFIFFYTKEDIDTGMLNRPAKWGIFDFENGNLIEEFDCKIKDFSSESFDKKYDVHKDNNYDLSNEYANKNFELLDKIRKEYINNKNILLDEYREYLERIIFNIPKQYQVFYYDLSIKIDKQEGELKMLTPQEQLEEYIEKNCNRYYVSYEEFKATPFFNIAKVYYPAGKKIEDNSSWTYQKTINIFSDDISTIHLYTNYEDAEEWFYLKKCDTDKKFAWRIRKENFTIPFASKWITLLFNSKGYSIRIIDTEKINPDIIKNYYKKQEELTKKDTNKELLTITASNIIDWLCFMNVDMSEKRMEETAENLLKYEDIALAVQHHIEYDQYDNSIIVAGYTAKQIHEEVKDKLEVIGVYNYLVTLKEKPEQGKEWLKQGLPRK